MRIVKKDVMPNGIGIQIEDWSEDYTSMKKESTLAVYPVAKESRERQSGWCYPKRGEQFRLAMDFNSSTDANAAFEALVKGKKKFRDYKKYIHEKELLRYI